MAWLKLTHLNGSKAILNTDQISEISERDDSIETGIRSDGTLMFYRETVEEIGAMIERGVWRDRVLQVACAIVSNEHSNGLTSEQVLARAVRFASIDPEQPKSIDT